MKLTTKEQLNIVLKSIKTLLSFKADKTDLDLKVDKSEISEDKALELVMEMNLVEPISDESGSIYTDENGVVYTL